LKIQFDGQQQYQVDAVNAVLDLFDGQPLAQGQFEIGPGADAGEFLSDLGFGNRLALGEEAILENLSEVQERNGIERSDELDGLNFTTEMETGTGKTYVYLRTIHELHARYGFNKFVIAVPRCHPGGRKDEHRDHARSLPVTLRRAAVRLLGLRLEARLILAAVHHLEPAPDPDHQH
jgi:hypothetical protein